MGAVTVITSGKGGVGKSTVTVGLAAALCRRGRRTLLIDADAGLRCLDRMTGVEARLVLDLSDVINGRCAPASALYACPAYANTFLLCAPLEEEAMPEPDEMVQLVGLLSRYFDHILIDCPAGVGRGFRAAAAAAQRALVVCTPDPICVRGAHIAAQTLKRMEIEDSRLLINRFSRNLFGAFSKGDLDSVIDAAGMQLLGLIPEDSDFSVPLMCGVPAPADSAGQMALSRIASRLEGERIALPRF